MNTKNTKKGSTPIIFGSLWFLVFFVLQTKKSQSLETNPRHPDLQIQFSLGLNDEASIFFVLLFFN